MASDGCDSTGSASGENFIERLLRVVAQHGKGRLAGGQPESKSQKKLCANALHEEQ